MFPLHLISSFVPILASGAEAKDYTQYVNLFIGTEGPVPGSAFSSDNVFPSASPLWGHESWHRHHTVEYIVRRQQRLHPRWQRCCNYYATRKLNR